MSSKSGRKRGELRGESAEAQALAGVLRDIADSHGRTLRDLAPRMHYSRTTISERLNGESRPPWEFVAEYLHACADGDRRATALLEARVRPLWEAAGPRRVQARPLAVPTVPARLPDDISSWVTTMRETAAAQQSVAKLQLSASRNLAITQGLTDMVARLAAAAQSLTEERDQLRRELLTRSDSAELLETRALLEDTQRRLEAAEQLLADTTQRLKEAQRQRAEAERLKDLALRQAAAARRRLAAIEQHAVAFATQVRTAIEAESDPPLMGDLDQSVAAQVLRRVDDALDAEASNLDELQGELASAPDHDVRLSADDVRLSASQADNADDYAASREQEADRRDPGQPRESFAGWSARTPAVPVIWGHVPARDKNFTGRENTLTQLQQDARGATAVLLDNALPIALQGLGGVGKTAIAVEYAYRYRSDYDLVWWIRADQLPLVVSSLAALANQLRLPGAADTDAHGAASVALDSLRRGDPYSRWLVIFDNADQPEELLRYIPSGPGDVLVTSRNYAWDLKTRMVPVDVFTRAESRRFLSLRVRRGISAAETDLLAESMGDLPLALEQAGGMLTETGMEVSEYLRLLNESAASILSAGKAPDYPSSLTAAWKISVSTLERHLPVARELLNCCAFFSPAPIPRSILRPSGQGAATGVAEVLADPLLLARSIRELARLALVRIDNRTIWAHRLIQALLRDDLSPREQARCRHDAHLILAGGTPQDPGDVRQWPLYKELVPHAFADAMRLDQCQDVAVRASALRIVRYLNAAGDPGSAKALAERMITQWTSDSGPDDQAVLSAQHQLGSTLRQLGEYPDARSITEAALGRAARILGERDTLTLGLSDEFGADLRNRGDYAMALSHHLEALHNCEAVFGADHPMTWRVASSLVVDYGLNSDFRKATDLGRRVYLAQSQSAGGASPVEILTSWTNLAWVNRLDGRFPEARDVAAEAKDYGHSQLGPEHPATLRVTLELANALRLDANSREEAKEQAGELFDICGRRLGENHPATLAAAVSLSNAQRATGLVEQSLALAERTLARYSDRYGADNPLWYGCAGNVAVLRRVSGDVAGARLLNETALAGLSSRLGGDSFFALTVAVNLASDLAQLWEIAAARRLGESTLARLRSIVSENHPVTLGCAANLVLDLRADGATDSADELAADTMNRYLQTLGSDHPDTQTAGAGRRLDFDFDPPYV